MSQKWPADAKVNCEPGRSSASTKPNHSCIPLLHEEPTLNQLAFINWTLECCWRRRNKFDSRHADRSHVIILVIYKGHLGRPRGGGGIFNLPWGIRRPAATKLFYICTNSLV